MIGTSVDEGNQIFIKYYKDEQVFGIWTVCYRTKLLKQCNMVLPSHVLYTDQYYATIPFASAKTIQSLDTVVYCYGIGRDGQSVSQESRIKHTQEMLDICVDLCGFYKKEKERNNENYQYLLNRISLYYVWSVRTILLHRVCRKMLENLGKFDENIKINFQDIYDYTLRGKMKTCLLIGNFQLSK